MLLLESGVLRLSKEVRAAAHAKFTVNRRLMGLSGDCARNARCASLGQSLDMTGNGRAPWAEAMMARLTEEPRGA